MSPETAIPLMIVVVGMIVLAIGVFRVAEARRPRDAAFAAAVAVAGTVIVGLELYLAVTGGR